MANYKDTFTADGRLKPGPAVTKTKLAAVKGLFEAALGGDRIAAAKFTESITTSDAIFNAAYLTTLQVLPQFDELPRTWSQIASVRELPDFRPAVLTGIFGGFEGLERQGTAAGNGQTNPEGIAPVVAELERYPYATLGEVEASYGRLKKRGFKVGYSWEARVNDSAVNFFAQLPNEMLNVALDTEEWEVYQALLSTQASRQLAGGAIYDGGANVTANSVLTRRAVIRAVQELSERTVNGRRIQVNGGYNLIVPIGARPAVEFALNQPMIQKLPGSSGGFVASITDPGVNIIGSITIIESAYVTGTNWYLLPKPGTVRRPVLELGRLRGNASPELRVHNVTGNYAGGGAVSPFEGSFDNDSIDLRMRYPLTGILWDDTYVIWSTGVGAAA